MASRRRLSGVILSAWAVAMGAVCATLLSSHLITLPEPDPALAQPALATLRPPGAHRGFVVHVMYVDCGCSRRIMGHLAQRGALEGVPEVVLLVGDDAARENALAIGGFQVVKVDPARLAEEFHVVAAPLLAVLGQDGTLLYTGGYTTRKQGPDIQDVSIVMATLAGVDADSLPLFGCATSQELQQTLDPLGLRF